MLQVGGTRLVDTDSAGHVDLSRRSEIVEDRAGEVLLERRYRVRRVVHAGEDGVSRGLTRKRCGAAPTVWLRWPAGC